jgi:hypothetical protein
VAHWFDLNAKKIAVITPDNGLYDISDVSHRFDETDNVNMGPTLLAEFVEELRTQFPSRKTYSEKQVITVFVKLAYRETASFGLAPQDGFCEIQKNLSSIMLKRRIVLSYTTVYRFLESLEWKKGRTTLKEVKRVFEVEAKEKRAYLASVKYQTLLVALKLMEE